MNREFMPINKTIGIIMLGIFFSGHFASGQAKTSNFPYLKSGLTEREAAAHLISRFTYGTTEREINNALTLGLEKWFGKQLNPGAEDPELQRKLKEYPILSLSNDSIMNHYYREAEILDMALKEGVIDDTTAYSADKKHLLSILKDYSARKGIELQGEMVKQFAGQKILRSIYSPHQLQEVLTEFWFNHFNVSMTNTTAKYVPNYERDVIRPNSLGNFEALLISTAKSPAMLIYLDNFISSAETKSNKQKPGKRPRGLNENYARELMELHTLGVDGGYTQKDVTEVARILTGWTTHRGKTNQSPSNKAMIVEGDFVFMGQRHDQGEKTVLGKLFPRNGGLDEGIELLKMLANHPSTANFICKKIATRFVSDDPPQSLIDKMGKTFLSTRGDIRSVLMTMVSSGEFWHKDAIRAKTKTPFELAISAVRALNADVAQPFELYKYIKQIGQRIYQFQPPTGFPDNSKFWINTGSLLNRMNFGMRVCSRKIPGVKIDLLALNNNHEPESSIDALKAYCAILLPGRDIQGTIDRVTPLLNDPDIKQKISRAATDNEMATDPTPDEETDQVAPVARDENDKYQLEQIVGIIIGSPEFQRR